MGYKNFYTLLLMVFFLIGCQSISPSSFQILSEQDCRYVYIVEDPLESRAYQIYENRFKDDNAKINYLINLIRYSHQRILRNGSVMGGDKIAQGIRYKYKKHREDATSVRDFIANIGSYSNKTGEKYYMFVSDKSICPTRYVLENELLRLESLS